MKTLKTVKFAYNQDQWDQVTEVVSVNSTWPARRVMEAWIDAKHSKDLHYCDTFTSNWTSSTFYDIVDNTVHSFSVTDFIPKEL